MSPIRPTSLDHVALWVAERDELADFLCGPLGMHVIERSDSFTLVGADARQGKLTLFDADGPRDPGVLGRVVVRVRDLDRATARLAARGAADAADGVPVFDAPAGLELGFVSGAGLDYDLDHVVLRVPDPERTAAALVELGFERDDGRLAIADRHVRLEAGGTEATERPLLNHLAVLVDSVDAVRPEVERRGFEVDRVVDAENTVAAFVEGPDGIVIEYVEHKPGFSLV